MRIRTLIFTLLTTLLSACGFHLQGEMKLAPQLHRLYIQSADPYGHLVRNIQQYLKMSNVDLVSCAAKADAVLVILSDENSQHLLSVSKTTQTRQYNLIVTAQFEINDACGRTIVAPQTLSESKTLTIQSNQILGTSNEANLFYQQLRRSLAYAIMNRLASRDITNQIECAFRNGPPPATQ